MNSSFRHTALAAVIVGFATGAFAQQIEEPRADRPYTGLFGGGIGETEQSLIAIGSLGGGWDNNAVVGRIQDPTFGPANLVNNSAEYGQVAGSLAYSLNRRRIGFNASAATSGRYLPAFSTPYVPSYGGNVDASLQLSRRAQLTASHVASFQPYKMLVLGPVIVGVTDVGQALFREQMFGVRRGTYVSQMSSVGLSRTIGRRSSVEFNAALTRSNSSSDGTGFNSRTAGGRFSTKVTKNLGLHLGYSFNEARLRAASDTDRVRYHNIDAGLDFARSLSLTRRTRLSFSTGSSVIDLNGHLYYRANGNALLAREIGRSWGAAVAYDRGVAFVEQFRQPFFSDSLTLSLGGLISRRLQFHSSASAVIGDVGLVRGNRYRSYNTVTGLSTALSRYLAIGADYVYFRYGFDDRQYLPEGLSREAGRHGVRVSLNAWAPLFHRARTPDAPR